MYINLNQMGLTNHPWFTKLVNSIKQYWVPDFVPLPGRTVYHLSKKWLQDTPLFTQEVGIYPLEHNKSKYVFFLSMSQMILLVSSCMDLLIVPFITMLTCYNTGSNKGTHFTMIWLGKWAHTHVIGLTMYFISSRSQPDRRVKWPLESSGMKPPGRHFEKLEC